MAIKQVHYSELTGKLILEDREIVKVRVLEHPALTGKPVVFEAAQGELKGIDKMALTVAVVELELPGEEPTRVVLDAASFDKLCTDGTMAELLTGSNSVESHRVERPTKVSERTNYASLEHAGAPHKGRTTEQEARLVRENLDAINARLTADGLRTIDPSDPKMRERYGFLDEPGPIHQDQDVTKYSHK